MREARNISAPNVASLLEMGYKPAEERFCGPLLRERHNRSSPTTQFASELEFTGTNTGVMTMAGREIPTNRQDCAREGRAYFARIKDGMIVQFSSHPDVAGLMMKLSER
jgi:hypothetical protein